jgi:hypothetical protein
MQVLLLFCVVFSFCNLGRNKLVDISGVFLPSHLSMFLGETKGMQQWQRKDVASDTGNGRLQLCYGEDPLSTRVMRL